MEYLKPLWQTLASNSRQRNLQPLQTSTVFTTSRLALVTRKSNGFIERVVQTVKQWMRKCATAGRDPNLAMLIYRATPLTTSVPSTAELLNGRKYRALLPTRCPIQNPHCQVVREPMEKDKDKMCEHYIKTARDLPSLSQNQTVYV